MLVRIAFILLVLSIIFVISESSKNKVYSSLVTTSKSDTVGKKYYLIKNKKKSTKLKPALCKLPQDIGPCRAAKQRFYYDSIANACKSFTYGGCRGNENNFRSLIKCEKKCKI